MFGIGMPELLVILAVALIVIGPKKLPDLARSLGKALGEFKRATNDLKQSIEQETGLDDVRKTIRKAGREAQAPFTSASQRTAEKPDGKKTEAADSADPSAPAQGEPSPQPGSSTDDPPAQPTDFQTSKENGTL